MSVETDASKALLGGKNKADLGEAAASAGSPAQKISSYRPDIDGLRAIAVSIVVIFHTGVSPLRGGFIGVDIFFVISGYLICGLLLNDLARGKLSLKTFYERRIRRILPAMLVMIAVVLALTPFLLFRPEQEVTLATAIASLTSVANLYLLGAAGYFEASATTQPLLHMWSLGVEEQFYLVFPLILILAKPLGATGMRWLTIALTIASLAASVVVTYANRDFAYYFPLTRAWELLVGALVLFIPQIAVPRLIREVTALGALVLIVGSAVKFHPGLYFPGYVALAPCLGAMALIAVGRMGGSAISKLLSLPPVVYIGLISYSLYLWHWPIFIGYRLIRGAEISIPEATGLVVASIFVAHLSWRYVERPFRNKTLLAARPKLFATAGITTLALVLVAVGLTFNAYRDTGQDRAAQIANYIDYDDTPVYRRGTCFLLGHTAAVSEYATDKCLTPVAGKLNVLIVGDSHGAHLWAGISHALPDANIMQATVTGCKPVMGGRGEKTCTAIMNNVLGPFLTTSKPDILVLSARWEEGDIPDVTRTLEALRGKAGKIVVFGPIVEYAMPLPRLLAQVEDGRASSLLVDARRPEQAKTDADLEAAVQKAGARYFSPYRLLCTSASAPCKTYDGDVPLQWDYGHLTREGSIYVADMAKKEGVLP